jgi:hypothetical protein
MSFPRRGTRTPVKTGLLHGKISMRNDDDSAGTWKRHRQRDALAIISSAYSSPAFDVKFNKILGGRVW